jgi:hypothetical protein
MNGERGWWERSKGEGRVGGRKGSMGTGRGTWERGNQVKGEKVSSGGNLTSGVPRRNLLL